MGSLEIQKHTTNLRTIWLLGTVLHKSGRCTTSLAQIPKAAISSGLPSTSTNVHIAKDSYNDTQIPKIRKASLTLNPPQSPEKVPGPYLRSWNSLPKGSYAGLFWCYSGFRAFSPLTRKLYNKPRPALPLTLSLKPLHPKP